MSEKLSRPLEELDPQKDWAEIATRLYLEGASDDEVIKGIQITQSQFDHYCQTVDAFRDLVERGRSYAKAWWLEQGRKAVKEKNNSFPQSLYAYSMANKYGWSNKQDKGAPTVDISLDKAKDDLKKALPEMAKLLGIDLTTPVRKVIEHGSDD
jgi:hypothetical protein